MGFMIVVFAFFLKGTSKVKSSVSATQSFVVQLSQDLSTNPFVSWRWWLVLCRFEGMSETSKDRARTVNKGVTRPDQISGSGALGEEGRERGLPIGDF